MKLPNEFIKTAKICGIEHLTNSQGHFFVEKNKVLSAGYPEGVEMVSNELENGVEAKVVVKKGMKIQEPLFFCFGMLDEKYDQKVFPNLEIQEEAEVKIVAHCSFPHAVDVQHKMEAVFEIGKNAKLEYEEHHYHGKKSGATVIPKMIVKVAKGGELVSNFNLSKGTVGQTKIEVEVHLADSAKAQIGTKVMGTGLKDDISIVDRVYLNGINSKSLIKMRAAAKNGGKVMMQGETYANADGAQGHVDCQEIVIGKNSVARAIPIVEVNHENARVTHEAAVGKVNQKELETLMTRGLTEDEATEMIIEAMLR